MMMVPDRLGIPLVLLKYGRLAYISSNAFFPKRASFRQLAAILASGCPVFHMRCAAGLDSFLDDGFPPLSFLRGLLQKVRSASIGSFPICPYKASFACEKSLDWYGV